MAKRREDKKIRKEQLKRKEEKAKQTQRLMGWTLAAIFIICAGLIVYSAVSGPEAVETVEPEVFQYEKQPVLGSKDAPVKMVEFADFKCPSCKQFHQTVFPQLKKDFIDTGKVQYYFINYPVISPNGDSRTAALAAEAVYRQNPEEFWKFHDSVFAHQQNEQTTWATPEFLVEIAQQANLKLDFAQLLKDIENETDAQDVENDQAIGNKAGVNGTPTLFINGQAVTIQDTFDYESLKQAILKASGESGNEAQQ